MLQNIHNLMDKIDVLAKVIWDYMHMDSQLRPADLILVFGTVGITSAQFVNRRKQSVRRVN